MPAAACLQESYRQLSEPDRWQYGERAVWSVIRNQLQPVPGRRILDVGCFRGDFLHWLGPDWTRFGIEPSAQARERAEEHGIECVASSIEELPDSPMCLSAITLIDVLEHLPRPLDSLKALTRHLVPGGRLVLFTGNTEAWSWRVSGLRYWYSALPEHVIFACPGWVEFSAPRLGLQVEAISPYAHDPKTLGPRVRETLQNLAWIAAQRLSVVVDASWASSLPLVGSLLKYPVVWWTSSRDHILVTLVKPPAKSE